MALEPGCLAPEVGLLRRVAALHPPGSLASFSPDLLASVKRRRHHPRFLLPTSTGTVGLSCCPQGQCQVSTWLTPSLEVPLPHSTRVTVSLSQSSHPPAPPASVPRLPLPPLLLPPSSNPSDGTDDSQCVPSRGKPPENVGTCSEPFLGACMLSCFSRVRLFLTLWTAAHQAPLSMGFSSQECWSGLPRPPPGDLPDPGIKPMSHVSCIGRWVLYH